MALKGIIQEIRKLSTADQYRLKEFLLNLLLLILQMNQYLKRFQSESIKMDLLFTCSHCHLNNAVRFGKYNVKMGSRILERQSYRCKECGKSFTYVTNILLFRTYLPHKWLEFVECMIEGYSLRKSSEHLKVHYVTLFYWRHKLLSAIKEMEL
jgi:transposase-like protein